MIKVCINIYSRIVITKVFISICLSTIGCINLSISCSEYISYNAPLDAVCFWSLTLPPTAFLFSSIRAEPIIVAIIIPPFNLHQSDKDLHLTWCWYCTMRPQELNLETHRLELFSHNIFRPSTSASTYSATDCCHVSSPCNNQFWVLNAVFCSFSANLRPKW